MHQENIKTQYEKLLKSPEFREGGYLCSIFCMSDFKDIEKETEPWQFDFYNGEKDTITSYVSVPETKKVNEDAEVYREKKEKLEKLDLGEKLLAFSTIIKAAEEELKKAGETANKTIAILQKANSKTIWNISFVTDRFNLINIKLGALTAEIIENKKIELMQWGAKS